MTGPSDDNKTHYDRLDNETAKILERHLPWIQKYVHHKLGRFLRTKLETGDIVQEATISFLKYGPRFKLINEKAFRSLLCRIVENALSNNYEWFTACRRNISIEKPLPTDSVLNLDPPQREQATPSKIAQQHEEEAWLRLGLELLDPEERRVIVMHHWELLSFNEIGKVLGLSREGARSRFIRALERLIETVESLKSGHLEDVLGEDFMKEMEP